jgi:hypothetical protein
VNKTKSNSIKLLGVIVLLLFLLQTTLAYTAPLSTFGFSEINLTTQSTKTCKDILISLPDQVKQELGEGILSINASFENQQNDNTFISVSINGAETQILWPEYFSCKDTCWARVFVPSIKTKDTKITLCVVLGGETKSIKVKESSFIAVVDTPVLKVTNSAPQQIFLGQRAKMSILVSNTGTKDANIFVQFVHPDTRAQVQITSFDIVDGESSAWAIIGAGETKQFEYYIKPSVVSSYNLPSTALFFTNIYGESQVMLSDHPQMTVANQNPIEVSLVVVQDQQPYLFKATIQNNSPEQFDGTIILSPQTSLTNPTENIQISPSSSKEIIFTAKNIPVGKYSFVASITDTNKIYSSNTINLEVKQSGLQIETILAALAIIVGLGIFAWIYFIKEK